MQYYEVLSVHAANRLSSEGHSIPMPLRGPGLSYQRGVTKILAALSPFCPFCVEAAGGIVLGPYGPIHTRYLT